MKIEKFKELFKETLHSFDFVNKYLTMDLEYTKRDYSSLIKEKILIGDVKKVLKKEFPEYRISNQHGGIYMKKMVDDLLFVFFFTILCNYLSGNRAEMI